MLSENKIGTSIIDDDKQSVDNSEYFLQKDDPIILEVIDQRKSSTPKLQSISPGKIKKHIKLNQEKQKGNPANYPSDDKPLKLALDVVGILLDDFGWKET